MKLSNLNKIFCFLIIILNFNLNLIAEEETIDIWKNNKSNDKTSDKKIDDQKIESPLVIKNKVTTNNIIQEQSAIEQNDTLLFGIWDPDKYDFELSMWSNTDGKSIQKTIKRINKLNLSETAENIFKYNFVLLLLT